MTGELAGARFVPDGGLRVLEDGRVLVGGSPLRVVRLSDAGAAVARGLLDGAPLGDSDAETALARRLLDGGLVHPVPGPGPHRPSEVTVVVPVRGTLGPGLLDALGEVAAVVVVDDASPVPVAVAPRTSAGVAIRLRRRSVRGGPAAARNTGLAAVTTPLVAFVDADCLPRPGWLEPLLDHLADPGVAAVAPRIVPREPDGAGRPGALARYEARRSSLDLGPVPGRVRARTRIPFVPSAALLARVEDLRELGGFDEAMAVGEDVDLVWRLDERGRTVRYEPAATVAHDHRTTPAAWARRRFDYGTSAGPLAVRHPGALVPLEASSWSVAAWGLAVAGHPAAGVGVAGTTAALLARRLQGLRDPLPVALRLAGLGHLAAGRLLADALVRPWWPLTVLAAARSRTARRAALAAAVLPPLAEWRRTRPPLDPARWVLLRLADDVAYGTGVWVGAVRARTAEPLVPDLTSWPHPARYSRWRAALGEGRGPEDRRR